jgi:hypothetical protein
MENILKTQNNEDSRTKKSEKASEQTIIDIKADTIVNELRNDFSEFDQQQLTNIIARYNEIIVEMLAKGHKVNTGLLNIKTSVKDSTTVKQSLQNSTIEITEVTIEKEKYIRKINPATTQGINGSKNENIVRSKEKYLTINDEIPACGIAFRQWLCKA